MRNCQSIYLHQLIKKDMFNTVIDEEKFTQVLRKVIREELEAMPKIENQFPGEDRLLRSMKEVAEYLGCSVVTAQNFKNAGLLPFVQKGRKVLFDKVELMKCTKLPRKKP